MEVLGQVKLTAYSIDLLLSQQNGSTAAQYRRNVIYGDDEQLELSYRRPEQRNGQDDHWLFLIPPQTFEDSLRAAIHLIIFSLLRKISTNKKCSCS